MSLQPEFTLHSESLSMRISAYGIIVILVVTGIRFIAIGNLASLAVGLILIVLSFLFLTRGIYKVQVSESSFVKVSRFTTKRIAFEQLERIYRNREGFAPIYIYVVKYTDENKRRIMKITFDATTSEIDEVMSRLGKIRPDLVLTTRE